MKVWTPERIKRAIEVLRATPKTRLDDACATLAAEWGIEVTRSGLTFGLYRYSHTTVPKELGLDIEAARLAAEDVNATQRQPAMTFEEAERILEEEDVAGASLDADSSKAYEQFSALVDLVKKTTKRGGITLEQVCDELGMSPRVARKYLDDAREVGIAIDIAHEKLLFRAPEAKPNAPPVAVAPPAHGGRDFRIGVFSDLHYGSLYCLREQHRDFVLRAYHEHGVRHFFGPGDTLEGYYRHAAFERSEESWEGQANEFLDWYPELPDMQWWFIDGNHDFTWTDRTGVESGRNLVRLARERGRNDLHFLGSRGALIQYGPTKIELWHPKKGAAYALSYQLQNKIRDTSPERLPHLLFCGHTHQYVKFKRSGVTAWYAGTFQHGDAPYGRSIGGDVAMGGIIVDWHIDESGKIRRLTDTFEEAYHQPKVFDVAI